MYTSLNPCLHTTDQLFCPTGSLGLLPCHPKQALFQQLPPSFSDPNQSDPWLLVQCDQPAANHGTISGPWRRSLLSHSVKSATISRSSPLAALKRSIQCWRLTESDPPLGPAPPESRPATAVTVSLVIPTGMNSGGQSGYDSRLAAVGGRASVFLVRSTSITLFPVFVHLSTG